MTVNSIARERLILELGDISRELARMAQDDENSDNLSGELASLGVRIEQLIGLIKAGGPPPEDGPGSKVVLVVDDNDELRDFVTQALELYGYNVLDAPDADSTMALLNDTEALDLVVCDVVLPDVKGPDLMQQILGLFPNVKSIFMSGYVAEDIVNQDVEQIISAGGCFLKKPFPTRKLLEAVHGMLGV